MGLDKKFLSENYKRMSDQELLSIISNDIKDLTADAQDALKEELVSRKLGDGIEEIIEIQLSGISEEKFIAYVEMIQNTPCPVCETKESKLNAALVFNNRYEDFIIACPACLKKEMENAQTRSLGLGLLGGVGGIVKSANQMSIYTKLLKQIESNKPSDALLIFIRKRVGEIELYRNDNDKFKKLIKYPNAVFS